jgi:hypothetical protein
VRLSGAEVSAAATLEMPEFEEDLQMDTINTAQQCMAAAMDHEFISSIEHTITRSCHKIEKVCTSWRMLFSSHNTIHFIFYAVLSGSKPGFYVWRAVLELSLITMYMFFDSAD